MQRDRFWVKIFTTRQILNWKFFVRSYFDLEFLQRVRFWNKTLIRVRFRFEKKTTHHILKLNNFDMSFFKRVCTKKMTLVFFVRLNNTFSNCHAFFEKKAFDLKAYHMSVFELMKQTSHQIFEYEECNVIDFELKFLQRVRFWIENFLSGHILI